MAKATKGGFIQMPKMMTDEPSVILKLKKGGHVGHKKAKHEHHEEHGHKSMHHMVAHHHAKHVEDGDAPKKPSMSERRKAMNPNLMKKGGVAHKQMGGVMTPGMARPGMVPAPVMGRRPMGAQVMAAPGMAQPGMKKGGKAHHHAKGGKIEHELHKVEQELKHHEKMKDSMHGGKAHLKHGGKAKHHASGGKIDKYETEGHGGMLGKKLDKFETKTTIEKKPKKFLETFVVDGDHHDKAHGTGEIHEGKAGGYKHGGKAHHKHHYAEGGSTSGDKIPSETRKSQTRGKSVMGGTIEGNEHFYEDTDVHSFERDHAHGTGGVRMANDGGYKHGGKAHKKHHYAHGGTIEGNEMKFAINNVDHTPKGKTNTRTGEVKESNAGGYKRGGHASKKAYATGGDVDMGQADRTLRQSSRGNEKREYHVVDSSGKIVSKHGSQSEAMRGALKDFDNLSVKRKYATGGTVNNEGQAVKMPRHFVSRPVANSLQSGTFKKGGKVASRHHYADGSSVQFAPGQDFTNVTPQDVADAKLRAKQTSAYNAATRQPTTDNYLNSMKQLLGIRGQTPSAPQQVPQPTPVGQKRGGRARH